MKKDCKFIVLSHYDFTNDKGEKVKGSKIVVTDGNYKLDLSTQNETIFKCELLQTYYCDLFVNDKLKVDITNIRK